MEKWFSKSKEQKACADALPETCGCINASLFCNDATNCRVAKAICEHAENANRANETQPMMLDWVELQAIKTIHPVKQSNGEILPSGHYNPDDFAKAVQEAVLRKNKLL